MLIKQNHIILQRETKHFVVCHIEQKRVLNSKKMQKIVLVDRLCCPYFLALVWCMKVSRESSRAYMKLVWWTGDWVPGCLEKEKSCKRRGGVRD